MSNYNFKLVNQTKTKNGKISYKTIRVTSKSKKFINVKELDKIYNHLVNNKNITTDKIKLIGNYKIKDAAIKGMTDMFRTLKNFDDDDIKTYDDYDEEYIQNKTLSKKKLNNFYFVDIILEI